MVSRITSPFYDLLDLSTIAYEFSNAAKAMFVYAVFIASE